MEILTNLRQPPQVDTVMYSLYEKELHYAVDGTNSYTMSNTIVHYRVTAYL